MVKKSIIIQEFYERFQFACRTNWNFDTTSIWFVFVQLGLF